MPLVKVPTMALYNPRGAGTAGQWDNGSASGANAGFVTYNEQYFDVGNGSTSLGAARWRIHVAADAEIGV